MEIFALIVVVGAVAAVAAAAQSRTAIVAAWRLAAERLGISFAPPTLFQHPTMRGTVEGCQVDVDVRTAGNDGTTTTTRYRVTYPRRLACRLELRPARAASGPKALEAADRIRVGSQIFDDRVLVKGSDPKAVRALLAPAAQTKILRLMDTSASVNIDDRSLRCTSRGPEKDASHLTTTVHRMVDLALTLAPVDPTRRRRAKSAREGASRAERSGPPPPRDPPRLDRGPPPTSRQAPGTRPPPARPVAPRSAPAGTVRVPATAAAKAGDASRALPPSREPQAASDPTPPPPPPPPSGSGGGSPTVEATCLRLFSSGVAPYELDRVFDAEFRGRRVTWSGVLRWVARYPFDRVFGQEHGARTTLDVHRLEGGFGERTIQAVVQVAPEDEPRLRRLSGRKLTFEGVLRACDGFRRQIYVERGVVGREVTEER